MDISKLQQDEVVEQFWQRTYWLSGEQIDETVEMIMIVKIFKRRKKFGVNEIRKESSDAKLLNTGGMLVKEELDRQLRVQDLSHTR